MPHGCLSNTLQDVTANAALWTLWGGNTRHTSSGRAAAAFLASSDAPTLVGPRQQLPQRLRHGARLGASFMGPPGTEDANAEAEEGKTSEGKTPADDPFAPWTNTAGLPTVTLTSKNEKYFSPDMADAAGDGSFKPTFGCKCGDWNPAPTHPMIEFRDSFIQSHPKFTSQLRKLKVDMTDTTAGKVHWDATYDIRRFSTPEDLARSSQPGGSLKLSDTMPAEKGSGNQLRFMTFCPPEPSAGDDTHAAEKAIPHEYLLKVTALDADEQPIDGFVDEESRYSAVPPEPEQPPGSEPVPTAAFQQPVVGTAKMSEG